MRRPPTVISLLIILLSTTLLYGADKLQPTARKIDNPVTTDLRVRPNLLTADTCSVRHDNGMVWQIDDWVLGNELYKNYLDPSLTCPNAYPFMVTEIRMPMVFAAATVIYVSVDVEAVDPTTPDCPFPDTIIAISSEYEVTVPGAGLYDIVVPLDVPVTVEGPFFAGFFLAGAIPETVGAAVITDSDSTVLCRSYNIWDESIGYIDLLNNTIWNFPGRLVLYASGIPGGSATTPEGRILTPAMDEMLFGWTTIWAHEPSGSGLVEYMSFEYAPEGGQYIEIGRDYDGSTPLRDGIGDAGTGDGFLLGWNFANLSEGPYTLRTTAWSAQGLVAADSITIQLEPTPPVPRILAPVDGTAICADITVLMFVPDENLNRVDLYLHETEPGYSCGLETLAMSQFGVAGENSEYYSAPIAAALALKLWAGRGYTDLMTDSLALLTTSELVQRLADRFQVIANNGAVDELVFSGLIDYCVEHGDPLKIGFVRDPDYFAIRRLVEDEQQTAMLALGGTPGVWLAVDGFNEIESSYVVRVMNPYTGAMDDCTINTSQGVTSIEVNGSRQRVDMMISMAGRNWTVARDWLGQDDNGSDGWSWFWSLESMTQDYSYFLRAVGTDAGGLSGEYAVNLTFDCSGYYIEGDYDNNGSTNVADLSILIAFLTANGPQPFGGGWRADANGDHHINLADVVYYMNYLFGSAPMPCY